MESLPSVIPASLGTTLTLLFICLGLALLAFARLSLGDWAPVFALLGIKRGDGPVPNLAAGFLIGAAAMVGIFVVEWVATIIQVTGTAAGVSFGFWALAFGLDAVYEELLFRGVWVGALAHLLRGRYWLAAMVSTVVFAIEHASNPNSTLWSVVGAFLGGLMYGVAFVRSHQIWLPIGVHFAWNLFQGPMLGFPVSGLVTGGMVLQLPIGPTWLTGGGYGPEAGVVGMGFRFVVIALLIGWLAYFGNHRADASPPANRGED